MKHKDLIARYLDDLTSPKEERQLRDALEAKTSLSEDERAVLELLSLSYPEEDTAALLAEDLVADFDAMTAKRMESIPLRGVLEGASRFTWRFATVLSIAAVLLIAFLLWPESHEETTIQQDVKLVIAEATSQPVPQPIIEEKEEGHAAEVRPVPQPVRKHRKAVRKQQVEPAEVIISAEPVEECAMAMEPTFNSYEDIEAEMLDIRSRGECVEAMVADLTRSF